jgi:CrcB protein
MRLLPFIAGAALGAPLRYLIDKFFRTKYVFPAGILIVNVIGSLDIGKIITLLWDSVEHLQHGQHLC